MDFQEIMEFNHPYNTKTFNKLIEKIRLNQIVPYIGAGMSMLFDGVYPSWGGFLNTTFKEYFDSSQKERFDQLNYEDKATFLYDEMGKITFSENLKEVFGERHIDKDSSYFKDKAMYLLPDIFEKGLLITTNYDKVIEKSYSLHSKHLPVSHPGHFEALNGSLRNSELLLYKIHGDISEAIDSIILTKEQYEFKYDNPELIEALRQIYTSKSILFLGCSLQKDRPIKLLCEVSKSGMINYAIISCKKETKREKRLELENKYFTQAIIYPDGEHECLRIILEEIKKRIKLKEEKYCNSIKSFELNELSQNRLEILNNDKSKDKVEDINYIYKVKICTDIKRLLIENNRIFMDYGPKSEAAKRNPISDACQIWQERKRNKIVPNNDKIVKIIEDNKDLFSISEYEICYEFIEHAIGFKMSCNHILEDMKQFPVKFSEVIDKYAKL